MKILILAFILLTSIACSKKGGGGGGIVINPPNTPVVAPTISYANYTQDVNSNVNITPALDKKGQEVNCSISPAFPPGLSLNPQTCVISGSFNDYLRGSYTVTATNSTGSSSASLDIYIKNKPFVFTFSDSGGQYAYPLELQFTTYTGVTIDWGDGRTEILEPGQHIIGPNYTGLPSDKHTITVTGKIDQVRFLPGSAYHEIEIVQWGDSSFSSTENMFSGIGGLKLPVDDSPIFAPGATAYGMFSFVGSYYFQADLSKWDVSNVVNMREMFSEMLNGLNAQDLSEWNVNNVMDCYNFSFNTTLSPASRPNFTNCYPNY